MNNYTSVCTETFQKFSKKSKSYDNTIERKGASSSNKKFACKSSYKHIRSMKREWREEVG